MKKFTKLWQLMMIILLSSSVAFAQKTVTVQDVLNKQTEKQTMLLKQQVQNGDIKLSNAEMEELGISNVKGINVDPNSELDPNAKPSYLSPTDAIFDPLFTWPLTNPTSLSVGIETDGNYIYTVHWQHDTIYRYDMDGNYIGYFLLSGVSQIRDLAYNPNNNYFYGAAASTTLWEMDFTFGAEALVSTITAPTAIRAIGFDDDNDYLFGNNWSSDVAIFDLTGALISSFSVGPVGGSYYGFAYDNNTAGGPFIWGYAQIGSNQNWIVQMNYPAGTETGVRYDVGSALGFGSLAGGLAVCPPGTFNDPPVGPGTWTLFGISQNEAMWGLDLDPNPCYAPVDGEATNVTQNSADLGWTETGTATSWDIEFGPAGFTPTGAPTYSGVTNPYNVTGLTTLTAYDFYVRSDCGGGDYSAWSGPYTFTTAGDCDWMCVGWDSYGDGWNGGSIDFVVDGSTVANWAGPSGSGPDTFYFPIGDPCTIDIVWNSGSWDSEVTYKIYDVFGTEIFSDGPNPTGTTGISGYCTVSCIPPTIVGTQNITDSQADAVWDENGTATTWNIIWGLPGFDPTDPAQYVGSASYSDPFGANPHTYTMTGLSSCTGYEWYIEADCGGGTLSMLMGPEYFFTMPGASGISAFPYVQTFDGFPVSTPAYSCTADGSVPLSECWTNYVGEDIDWDVYTGSTGSGSTGPSDDVTGGGNYLYTEASSCYNSVGTVISPEFDFTGLTTPQLTFSYHMYGSGMGTMQVDISTDGGTTWDSIWGMSGDQGNQWNVAVLQLPAYGGAASAMFRWVGTTGSSYTSDMAIDQVEIEEAPACPDPTNASYTNQTATTVDLTWTSFSGLSDIIWGPEGFDPTTSGTYVLGVTSPYTLTGLTPVTGYDYYVRDDCGGGTVSGWVGPTTFYTTPTNDECANAEVITGPYPQIVSGTTTGATVDCPGVLDWAGVWYSIDLPYDYNVVEINLCLDDPGATLNNTGIVLTADCSCDANSLIYSTGTWSVTGGCIDSLVFMVEGPGTVYFPVFVDPMGDFTFDVNVLEMYGVVGTLYYANSASTPLDSSYVNLYDATAVKLATQQTTDLGEYSFTYLPAGNYSLEAQSYKPWGGITTVDAILTKRYAVGLISLSPLKQLAADVNLAGGVTTIDGIMIQRRAVGLLNSWPAPDYVFENPAFTLPPSTVLNIGALCSGDVNGSYTPPAGFFPPPPPANNDCANAEAIGEVANYPFSTLYATASGTTPSCGGSTAPIDIWYVYTATADGTLDIDLCGSGYDTRLAVWDSCGGTEIDCNDDDCGLQSAVSIPVISGNSYYIQVGGYNAANGDGDISITFTP